MCIETEQWGIGKYIDDGDRQYRIRQHRGYELGPWGHRDIDLSFSFNNQKLYDLGSMKVSF